jgi:hypothetical protein
LGTLGGILPVIMANRIVTFERISQYTLPASLTGVIFLGGLIYSIFPREIRGIVLSVLLGLAVLAQHGLAAQAVREEQVISDFWRQVLWRAPDIKHGTTLVAVYPNINYLDGNDVVWGPANFIYANEYQGKSPIDVPISASRLEADSILNIINGSRDFEQIDLIIKNTVTTYNYKNLLILSQPSETVCVHAIDPRWPNISINDQPFIHASFQNSKIENIITRPEFPSLPVYAFGTELPHEWCYYFQKADLARQQGDWEMVMQLGDEAQQLGLHPNDQIEWLPFLQAYAILGDQKKIKEISTRINTDPFYQRQACENLNTLTTHGYVLSPETQSQVDKLFCKKQ